MKRILVVDDDLEQRELYAQLFIEHGFEVITANDGLEGLEKALDEKPNLIFTGIIMPRMDGFELIHNLRNNTLTVLTPVIMFSHLAREEDRQKAAELNDVYFMIKGYDSPAVILAKARELLEPKKHKIGPDDDRPARTTI